MERTSCCGSLIFLHHPTHLRKDNLLLFWAELDKETAQGTLQQTGP